MDTLSECVAALAQRDISSRELTDEFLSRSTQANPVLNAYISIDADGARLAAAQADERRAAGESQPLLGVPIAHKDIFCTDGLRTTCGSRMLENFVAPYDATVVDRLRSAGAVTLGKTNMDEFAMGSSNESSYFGPVANPWDLERVPGGSSGGSAAAVAASLAPAATGTDTGGSIRQPAAFCGLTGLKPTYGRVSRYGMIAYASSLDQGGPMAWSAADCALLLATMAGHDAKDATSVDVPTQDYVADVNQPMSGLRIGLPREYYDGLDSAQVSQLTATRAIFEQAGATIVDVSLPHTASAVAAYYVIAPAECSANLSRYDGVRYGHRCEHPQDLADLYARSRAEGFGNEVKRRILAGTYVLSVGYFDAYYRQAQRVRRLIRQDFLDAYAAVDMLLTPTTPGPAFVRGELSDPLTMYQQDVYTVPASLAGMPAISFPVGMNAGLPMGAQLIGPHFSESRLLAAANQFQQATDFHTQRPTTDLSGPHAGANQ